MPPLRLSVVAGAGQCAGGEDAAVAAAADGNDPLAVRELVETAGQLVERDVDCAFDVPGLPFRGLANVDQDDGSLVEQVGCASGVDCWRACEQAHCSGLRGALDDDGEFAADLGGDRGELGVVDDREHALGVDRRDVRFAVVLVDDDVAG
jgi:hypothetical protein